MRSPPSTSVLSVMHYRAGGLDRRLGVTLALSAVFHATILYSPVLRLQPIAATGSVIHVSLVPGHATRQSSPSLPAGRAEDSHLPSSATSTATAPVSPRGGDTEQAGAADLPSLDNLHTIPIDSAYNLPESPGPAHWADLEYLITVGDQSKATGRARYRYQIQEDKKYRLNYREEPLKEGTAGIDPEFWLGEAHGDIGPNGLQPQPSAGLTDQPALADARLMNTLFQFMHIPPGRPGTSGDLQVGGTAYRYDVLDLQSLETDSRGTLVTVHVRISQTVTQAPSVEVWLAVDYRYLPVRIRQVNSAGKVTLLSVDRFSME